MRVVVTIAAVNPQHGGPARTAPALCRALARNGAEVELVTISERGIAPLTDATGFKITAIETQADHYHPRSWSTPFKQALVSALHAKDVILYDVGLWLPANHFASQIARQTRTPFIASPRGMLSPEALTVAKWKKRAAWLLYQKSDLKAARALHATSESEAHDFRALGLTQPIAVIPNGVDLPEETARPVRAGNGVRTLLFLSRLHPIKGLKDLVHAWGWVRPSGWEAIVAGPDENGHRGEIESLVDTLGLRKDFQFVGSMEEQAKWSLLSSADLFVLPSYSENFGLVVAEALSCALPVITTRATPWRELESHRCGWWIETGPEALANALSIATKHTDTELRQMGERGRNLIRANYSWDELSGKMLSVFEWLVGRRDKPTWLM